MVLSDTLILSVGVLRSCFEQALSLGVCLFYKVFQRFTFWIATDSIICFDLPKCILIDFICFPLILCVLLDYLFSIDFICFLLMLFVFY